MPFRHSAVWVCGSNIRHVNTSMVSWSPAKSNDDERQITRAQTRSLWTANIIGYVATTVQCSVLGVDLCIQSRSQSHWSYAADDVYYGRSTFVREAIVTKQAAYGKYRQHQMTHPWLRTIIILISICRNHNRNIVITNEWTVRCRYVGSPPLNYLMKFLSLCGRFIE